MTNKERDKCPDCGKEFNKNECESHKDSKTKCYYCHLNEDHPKGHIVKEEEVVKP